ncbi:MAG: hypothetical protein HFG54_15035 [Lachnospiraceae bacterium]|nr:hypothetical protein [Lachnospiraceae bacterium]
MAAKEKKHRRLIFWQRYKKVALPGRTGERKEVLQLTVKITIGTVSSSTDWEEDIKLIKSSLLYADEIELIGMVEYAIFKYLPERIYSIKDIDTLADSFTPFLKSIGVDGSQEVIEQLEYIKKQIAPYKTYLMKKKHLSKQELLAQAKINQVVQQTKELLIQEIGQFTESPAAIEINKLIEKEIISVFDYKNIDFNIDELAGGYFGNVIRAMQNNTAYPLFDKTSNDMIVSFSKSRLLDLGNINQEVLVHAGLATNILMTLPTLEKASVDEILDFKKEMQGPLVNFRKAIYEFSETVGSRPWDQDFQYDCLKIYGKEVAPKVEELNERSSETSVLKNMGRKVIADEEIRKKASWATGGLVTTITTNTNILGAFDVFKDWLLGLSMIVVAPNVVSAFLKTLNMASEAKREIMEKEQEMRGNTMYYYYKASKELC